MTQITSVIILAEIQGLEFTQSLEKTEFYH